jgi:hypothetical protein
MTNSRSRIAGCFILGALCVPALPTMAGARLSVEVDEPECKILQAADKDGDLEIAIKVSVQNTSESEAEVKAIVQGIDREGFEVFELRLSDAIKAGQTRVLTDSDFLQERRYKTIVRWRVEEVTVRPGQPGSAAQPTPDAPR